MTKKMTKAKIKCHYSCHFCHFHFQNIKICFLYLSLLIYVSIIITKNYFIFYSIKYYSKKMYRYIYEVLLCNNEIFFERSITNIVNIVNNKFNHHSTFINITNSMVNTKIQTPNSNINKSFNRNNMSCIKKIRKIPYKLFFVCDYKKKIGTNIPKKILNEHQRKKQYNVISNDFFN
jgi:hypothetical protein